MRVLSPLLGLLSITVLSLPSMGHAGEANESLPDLAYSVQAQSLEATAPEAHHFNAEAPAKAKDGAKELKVQVAPQKLTVRLTPHPSEREVAVEVYVCDDAKTYCKKKKQGFRVPATAALATSPAAPPSTVPPPAVPRTQKASSAHVEKDTDFIVDDPEKAFALAAKKKLPLMIDFFGIWCPPCNHLDGVVFRSKEFRSKTSPRFVKLKVDTDRERFNALKNHYRIQSIPTVIFATPAGDEILRVVGFQPLDEMLAKSEVAHRNREEGFAAIAAQASGGNAEARYKAARIALDRDEPAKALEWLEPLKELLQATHNPPRARDPRLADYYRAQLGVAQAKSDQKQVRETLEQWLKDFPDGVAAVENHQALAEIHKEAGDADDSRKSLEAAIAAADKVVAGAPDSLKGQSYSPGEMAELRADLIDQLGDKARAKAAYLACTEAFAKEASAEKSAFPRGPSLGRGYCLGKAGEIAQAEAIYREGIKRYPQEYTFHQGMARLWLEAQAPEKALPEALLAVKHSYGNQTLKSLMTLARAYEALHQPDKAIAAIEEQLKIKLPADAAPSTLKLTERLRAKAEALRKLPAPSPKPAA
jgi:thiol-disulfide isomerase/thioredoxin